MIRKVIFAALLTSVLLAAPAVAQPYGGGVTIDIDDPSVDPGQVVTLSGFCLGADTVVFTINGVEIGSAPVTPPAPPADESDPGTYSVQITLPNLAPGTYTILATCGTEVAGTEITVGGTGTVPPTTGGGSPTTTGGGSGPLADTGSNTNELVRIGAILLVGGAALTLVATKRRRSHSYE